MSEDHPNCGTPDCCGKCNSVDEAKTNNAVVMARNIDKLTKLIPPVKKEDVAGTSTASVAGAGSDSSTVVVRKKPNVLKRFRKYVEDVRVNEAVDLEKKIRAHHDKLNALEADAHDAQYGRARTNKAATTKVRQTLGKHITTHYGRELDHQEKANVYTALQNKKSLPKL